MSANTPAKSIGSSDDSEQDLLIASRKYMSDNLSLDELEHIQHLHAQKFKVAVLELAEPSQPNWLRSFLEHFRKP